MSIPHQLDLQGTVQALEVFRAAGHAEVDTAIMYEGGQTEKTLGEENCAVHWGGARNTNIRHTTMYYAYLVLNPDGEGAKYLVKNTVEKRRFS